MWIGSLDLLHFGWFVVFALFLLWSRYGSNAEMSQGENERSVVPAELAHRKGQERLAEMIPQTALYESANPFVNYLHNKRRKVVLGLVGGSKGLVLDLGCGDGFFLERLGDAIGVDLSKTRVQRAKRRSGKPVLVCSAQKIPFRSNAFDLVVVSEVLEHLTDPDECLAEIACVLKDGGSAIISVPNDRVMKMGGRFAHVLGNIVGGISGRMKYQLPTVRDHLHEISPDHLRTFLMPVRRSNIFFNLPFRLAFFHIGLYRTK